MRAGEVFQSFGLGTACSPGAGVVLFAYIGFRRPSRRRRRSARIPKRDLPIGILSSLVICTILYILMALVLTGVVPYAKLGVPDPVAVGIRPASSSLRAVVAHRRRASSPRS